MLSVQILVRFELVTFVCAEPAKECAWGDPHTISFVQAHTVNDPARSSFGDGALWRV